MGIAVLYPVLAQIVLTLVVGLIMGLQRRAALKARDVRIPDIALDNSGWPDYARQSSNCYNNQFELPVIFYVLCLIAQITRIADLIFIILAWIFVLTRVIHAYIHITSNRVPMRGAVFGIGFIVIAIMTAFELFRLLLPPA